MIALTLRDLGQLLLDDGRVAAAEELLRESVAIYRAALPAEDWRIADATSRLGSCLVAGSRYAEAEPLLLAGASGLKASRGDADRLTRAALERVQRLYESWQKPEEAS
ncbi:MAG: tetratricopeptide repeat protein [Acidobacteriota bacterium]